MANKNIIKGEDGTLKRNSIEHWKFLINEYNLIKNKKHSRFKFVTEFYNFYNLKRQNFIKYLTPTMDKKLFKNNLCKVF